MSQKYSFVCGCPCCSLPAKESRESDCRRGLLALAIRGLDVTDRAVFESWRADPSVLDRIADAELDPQDEFALEQWVADRTLPDDKVINRSRTIVDLMLKEGLYNERIWPMHYSRLFKAYCALSDEDNAKEWGRRIVTLMTAFTGSDAGWSKVAAAPEKTAWWGLRRRASH